MRQQILHAFIVISLLLCLSCTKDNAPKQPPSNTTPRTPSAEMNEVLKEQSDFTYNKDFQSRDKLLGINVEWGKTDSGGIERFNELDIDKFEMLLKQRFINPYDRQNESPTAKDFFIFMMKYPQVHAHGYAVSPDRGDYAVIVEGLSAPSSYVTEELRKDFAEFCKGADELSTDGDLRSWWD